MKVPNKILKIVEQYTNIDVPGVSETDRTALREWVVAGLAKRQAMADEKKSSSKEEK